MRAFLPIILLAFGSVGSPSQGKPQVEKKLTPKQIFQTYNDSVVTVVTNDGSGSGFFVKNGLLVATCYHVIKGATSIEVQGTKGEKWKVGFVYFDKDSDAAILKLADESGRKPIPVGDFSKLTTGDDLSIIGNPLGFLDQSLTTGIVSAKRNDGKVNLIQTTAAISPGSSGSPVLNSFGKFVGFVSYHFTEGQALNMAVSSGSIVKLWDADNVPVAAFIAAGMESIKNKPAAKNNILPSEAKSKAEKNRLVLASYSKYYKNLTKEYIKWNLFYHQMLLVPGLSDRVVVDRNYEVAGHLISAAGNYEVFANQMKGVWTEPDEGAFFAWLKDFLDSLRDLAAKRAEFRLGLGNFDHLVREHIRCMSRSEALQRKLFDQFQDAEWFNWQEFRRLISPPIAASMFGVSLDGLDPDPAFESECYIGFASKDTGIPSGTKIVGIKRSGDLMFTPTHDWSELQDLIHAWHLKDPVSTVKVKYGGMSEGEQWIKVSWPKDIETKSETNGDGPKW